MLELPLTFDYRKIFQTKNHFSVKTVSFCLLTRKSIAVLFLVKEIVLIGIYISLQYSGNIIYLAIYLFCCR